MPNPITHFEIIGKDGKKLQDFYAGLFDWQVDASNPMNYGIVQPQDGRGTGGGIGQGETPALTFYVEVEDVQAYLDKAQSLGAKVILPRTVMPGMATYAQIADPEGNVIGLAETEVPH